MADNYLENHELDYEKRKAKKDRERQLRRNRYLAAYRKKLEEQKACAQDSTGNASQE